MIVANGMEYKTLKQNLYANGKKVVEAYCNGNLVYPEREDTQLIKVVGSINTAVSHDHAGENPSCTSLDDCHYTYHGGDTYRAKGCFCLVMRNHSYNGSLQKSTLAFQQATKTIPAAKWPLSGAYSASKSNGDLYGPGNAWVVYTYQGGSCPMLPTAGEGIHPLLGSDAIETHTLNKSGNLIRAYYSAELLLYLDVSAPRICPWSCDKLYVGTGYPLLDAEATPVDPYLNALPGDVNGFYRLSIYRRDTYYSFDWTVKGPTGRNFHISLSPGSGTKNSTIFSSHLKISTGGYSSNGYDVPYILRGTRHGVYQEFEHTYRARFKILNIPITQLIYSGKELSAPAEHLHPRVEDLAPFI